LTGRVHARRAIIRGFTPIVPQTAGRDDLRR